MKKHPYVVFAGLCLLALTKIASGAEAGPNYAESVELARAHAVNPVGWQAPSLVVIPDVPGGSEGLRWESGKLVVRTATKSRNFKGNYVGQAGYKIYGQPTTDASWVTTGNDAARFLLANGVTGDNVTTLLERGLGMDATKTHDAVVEFAVDPAYLLRPTRNPDITQYLPAAYGDNLPFVQPVAMSDEAFNNFKSYYENWRADAYSRYPFPWTQLGYTFFWGNGYTLDKISGMSEFILPGGSPADIYGIYATRSYIYTRNDGTGFSSAADAAYGNGFASFKIDGSCDTVWAGHRFQKNIRANPATPNQMIVESNGSISGGQGLLIWSLNYDVRNDGEIIGATFSKYGIDGTANIAVLFKGDTGAAYGTPVVSGLNRLTNAGTISSPGTAIKAEAGDTVIVNSGRISGGDYAIQTGPGNDTVTLNGGEISGRIDLGAGVDAFSATGTGPARLHFILNRDTAATAQIANAETVAIADNTALAVQVAGTGNIRNNDRFVIVETPALTVDPAKLSIIGDGTFPMLAFTAEKAGNSLFLVAVRDGGYYGRQSGNASLGAVLDSLANTATGDMSMILGALDGSGNPGNARQLEPTPGGGALQAGFVTADLVNQSVVGRIDQIRASRSAGSGMGVISTGDGAAWGGLWGRGFGAALHQDRQGESHGYRANVRGGAFGYDRLLSDRMIWGFGGGYAKNRVTTDDDRARTDFDSYQGNLYGSLVRDACYLEGVLSFASHRYETSRHIAFGAIDRTARGNYAGRQYSGYLESGVVLASAGGLVVTPFVSLQAMRLHLDDYTETGAGALNLRVEGRDHNLFQVGPGINLAFPLQRGGYRIIPELRTKWLVDFAGEHEQTVAQFTDGASFTTQGLEPVRSSGSVGATLTLLTASRATFALSYDFATKAGFTGHTGYLEVRYAF